MWPAEDAYRDLLEWADQITGLDVQPEVNRGTAGLPAGARVAVFGSGASVHGPPVPDPSPGGHAATLAAGPPKTR